MSNFIIITLFICLSINCVASFKDVISETRKEVIREIKNNNHIVTMVKDYTLINLPEATSYISNEFSLNNYNERERETEGKKEKGTKLIQKIKNHIWMSSIVNYWDKLTTDDFETRVQSEVDSLNRVIINATDGLLNMCENMIAKTTSSLPLSYSSYTHFETEMRFQKKKEENNDDDGSGLFGFFSSASLKKTEDKSIVLSKELDKAELKTEVIEQMYDYQQYRLAINNRQAFLNGLCFNTFGDPYTLYYNSTDNTLINAFDPSRLNYYTVIVQNIIDNSLIRGLNKGINGQNLKYDVDLDSEKDKKDKKDKKDNKDKKEILVEKAKYILSILQKLEQRLPDYLLNIGKRSLTVDEYFANLRHFWADILDEANIAAHDSPSKYEAELLEKRKAREAREETDRKARQAKEETDKRARLEREETDKRAREEAERVIQEFKNKQLLTDAKDYIREQKIVQKDKRQNYSVVEWEQLKRQVKLHVSGFTGSLVSGIDGIIKVPVDYILGFASDTIWDLGVIAIMALILIAICLRIYNKIMSMCSFSFLNEVKTK